MSATPRLKSGSIGDLGAFTAQQLDMLFPVPRGAGHTIAQLEPFVSQALQAIGPMLDAVRIFEGGRFDHFHSLQYSAYIYWLGRRAWLVDPQSQLVDRLFCLNRALNAIDLHPAVDMPPVFFISHGLGAVLGNATYNDRLVFFQNVTVGRVSDRRPTIGRNVVLYPGSSVTGGARIGSNCVIAAGTAVHNQIIPDGSLVTNENGRVLVRPLERDYVSLYLGPE